jgi:DNA-binding LacI/PurR family transcriptional regulator
MAQRPAERQRVEHHLTTQHVDGVMLLSLHGADPLPAMLGERGLPTVLGGRTVSAIAPHWPVRWVDSDNEGGARTAVEYLIASGRQRIAHVAGTQDMAVGIERLAGYRAALAAAGRPVRPSDVEAGDFSEDSGAAATRALLERVPDLDAIFVGSDVMALGTLRALRQAGCRVPDDIAVVGFDDAWVAKQSDPPLTTIHQPVEGMGRAMARLLFDLINGEEVPDVLLQTHLVHRASA